MSKLANYTALLILLALAALPVFSDDNWNGWGDTLVIADTITTAKTVYTTGKRLGAWERCRVAIMANDTSSAGFSADSISLIWGYQGFHQVKNGSGSTDTLFEAQQVLDTIQTADFGTYAAGTVVNTGIPTYTWGQVDTSSVTGFAIQERQFTPFWNVYIRFFVTGLAANRQGGKVKIRFVYTTRIYAPTRGQ